MCGAAFPQVASERCAPSYHLSMHGFSDHPGRSVEDFRWADSSIPVPATCAAEESRLRHEVRLDPRFDPKVMVYGLALTVEVGLTAGGGCQAAS